MVVASAAADWSDTLDCNKMKPNGQPSHRHREELDGDGSNRSFCPSGAVPKYEMEPIWRLAIGCDDAMK